MERLNRMGTGHTGHCPQPAHTGLGSSPTVGQTAPVRSRITTHLTDPGGMAGWVVSRPCWLTDSGRFTHKVITRPAVSLAQNRESTPAEPAVLTTMPRHHWITQCLFDWEPWDSTHCQSRRKDPRTRGTQGPHLAYEKNAPFQHGNVKKFLGRGHRKQIF